LANVDQFKKMSFIFAFSKKFAIKPLSCFPLHFIYVATLPCETWNAISFYHYSCYKNLRRNLFIFLLNVILSYYLTYITITYLWLNSNCLSCARSVVTFLSSSETTCQLMSAHSLRVSDSHFRLLKWETPTFISSADPTSSKLQNLHRNLAAGVPKKNSQCECTDIWYGIALLMIRCSKHATDEWCKRLWMCVQLTADSTFMQFSVLVWWNLQVC